MNFGSYGRQIWNSKFCSRSSRRVVNSEDTFRDLNTTRGSRWRNQNRWDTEALSNGRSLQNGARPVFEVRFSRGYWNLLRMLRLSPTAIPIPIVLSRIPSPAAPQRCKEEKYSLLDRKHGEEMLSEQEPE